VTPGQDRAAAEGRAAVERELTRLMRRARAASARLASEVHPDLDAAGYAVLVTVVDLQGSHREGVRASEVAAAVGLHKSTMSRNIADLERLGLVERVPDPTDARARLLRLTAAGSEAVQRSRAGRRRRLAAQMDGWSAADLKQLGTLLQRFNDQVS
jgi:DNA-binding MarR family transcriptional regulator